ncbi:MAG: hypothetical protein WDW38_010841 [Sanguina aurantia]
MSGEYMSSSSAVAGPVTQSAVMVIGSRLKDYGSQVFKQRKPWSEVVDRSAFSKPATFVGTVLLSAISIGAAAVVVHGATREPDNLFIDEGETQQGLLSIFSLPPATGAHSQV